MTAKCMAILMAVERWRHSIENYQFIIKTGHKSLKFLLEQRTHTLIQRKGLTKLLELKYTIQYRKRKENTMAMADALSRRVEDKASNDSGEVMDGCLTIISTVSPV
ncbi:hypothetical protein Peur_013930 [Populus x canadensis]